jgi:16S rRNA (cytosine1402-N4)-methyltransferase
MSSNFSNLVVNSRKSKKIETTEDLKKLINKFSQNTPNLSYQKAQKLIFQSLRIYVNEELTNIKKLVESQESFLKRNSIGIFLTFHSLETKTLIQSLRSAMNERYREGKLTKKAVKPTSEEILENSASKSAEMTVIEWKKDSSRKKLERRSEQNYDKSALKTGII